MQKVHELLHPTDIDTQPECTDSRLVGRVDGKVSRDSRISSSAAALCRALWRSVGRDPMLWVPKTTSTQGAFSRTVFWSFWARHPPTAICIPGCTSLVLLSWPRFP